jgi:hypothetical protein
MSLREVRNLFRLIGIRELFEHALTWEELCILRSEPVMQQLAYETVIEGRFLFQPQRWNQVTRVQHTDQRDRPLQRILHSLDQLLKD